MLSICIVGCGFIGEKHLRCFLSTGRVSVAGFSRDPERRRELSDRYGVPMLSDYESVLEGSWDAVVICVPANLHIDYGLRALKARKHVLLEKPLSCSLQGVDVLQRLRDETRLSACVAYVLHFIPCLIEAGDFLRSGKLGRILQVTVTAGYPLPGMRGGDAQPYDKTYYRDRRTGGGAIQDALTHYASWVESIVGPAESVLCDSAHVAVPNVEVEDLAHVLSRHGGTRVSYTLNQFQAPNETTMQFNTASGSVKIEMHRERWGMHRTGEKDWTWNDAPVMGSDDLFATQAVAFLDHIAGIPGRLCSLEAATDTLRFTLAALASTDEGGCRVEVAHRPSAGV